MEFIECCSKQFDIYALFFFFFFKLVRSSYIHRTILKGTFPLGKYNLDLSNLALCINQDFKVLQNIYCCCFTSSNAEQE